jgi:putative membrane protein
MMYYGHQVGSMMGWGYGTGWMVLWAVVLIGIVGLLVWLASRVSSTTHTHREAPMEILKVRYARGEIDHEEYRRMLEELRR